MSMYYSDTTYWQLKPQWLLVQLRLPPLEQRHLQDSSTRHNIRDSSALQRDGVRGGHDGDDGDRQQRDDGDAQRGELLLVYLRCARLHFDQASPNKNNICLGVRQA